ncbi:MAG: hypothetical protein WCC54_26610, partial [Pseudolabrys sp.]
MSHSSSIIVDEATALLLSHRLSFDWKETQQTEITNAGIAPSNDKEAALIATLTAGNYTAIVRGKNGGTGVCLAEVYDLDQAADSRLANVSTRAFVGTG